MNYGNPNYNNGMNTNYPPMQPSHAQLYPSFQQPQAPVVVVNSANQANLLPRDASFSAVSTKVCCKQCNYVGMTNVTTHVGCTTFIWCIVLGFVTPFNLLCLCVDTCKDRTHYCGKCGSIAGEYKKPCL